MSDIQTTAFQGGLLQRSARHQLAMVLVLAAIVRGIWLAICPNEPISDQVIYHEAAENILAGRGFVDRSGVPIGFWPMGYSLALAGVYGVLGTHIGSAYAFNFALGLLTVWVTYWLAKLLYGERAGIFAGLGMALYPGLVMYVTVIGSENLYIPLSIATIALAVKAQQPTAGWRHVVACGLVAGICTIVRPNSAVFPIIVACAAWLLGRGWRHGIAHALVVLATLLTVALPYGLHNKKMFGEFSTTPFNGGVLLFTGNHEGADGLNVDLVGMRRLNADGRGIPLPEYDRQLRKRAVDFIIKNPFEFILLVLNRTYHTIKAEAVAVGWNAIGIEKTFGPHGMFAFKVIASGAWYALMFGFLLSLARKARERAFGRPEIFLLIAILTGSLPFLIVLGMDRYHLPLVPLLMVLAATLFAGTRTQNEAKAEPVRT